MTWEAASAIAQILGSVAIVITLIYLAAQIRQTNRATLISGNYQVTEQWHKWSELIVTTPDLPAVILRGNASLKDLTGEEALRYGSYAQMFFDIVENYLRLIRQLGLASEEKVLQSIVGHRVAAPGMMEWWRVKSSGLLQRSSQLDSRGYRGPGSWKDSVGVAKPPLV